MTPARRYLRAMKNADQFVSHVRQLTAEIRSGEGTDRRRRALMRLTTAIASFFGPGHHRTTQINSLFGHVLAEIELTIVPMRDTTDRLLNYLDAMCDDITDEWEDSHVAEIRLATHESLLDIAESLLSGRNPAPMAAVMVAGAVLENHLRTLIESRGLMMQDVGIAAANKVLKARSVYNKGDWSQVEAWGHQRNTAAHHLTDQFEPALAPGMVHGVRAFIGRYPA